LATLTHPVVETMAGPVVGRQLGALNVFKGIPYAAPPVGPLRFRPPQPLTAWAEPRDASRFGNGPMQPEDARFDLGAARSEDCLYLNIWAPAAPGPHPVLFWIYGGANTTGAGSLPTYDGAKFAEQGLVFISANYRLGSFGAVEWGGLIPELAGSGVNGLRDLIAALGWVRDNIAGFGGDPQQVTLMGESAGGKNICALAASPAARGLFGRVAIQSGSGQTVFGSIDEATPVARAILAAAGLDDPRELLSLPAEAVIAAQVAALKDWPQAFPIRPTVDSEIMPQRPVDAANAGATRRLRIIIGTTRDEWALFNPPGLPFEPLASRQLGNLDLATMQDMERRYATALPEISAEDRRIRMLTAEHFWMPSVRFAEAHAAAGGEGYMYRFDLESESGVFQGYAPHAADLQFIFDLSPESFSLGIEIDKPELSRAVHRMWGDWARTGEAKLAGAPAWSPYRPEGRETLLIDDQLSVAGDPAGEERELWTGVA
jgi:para-nitrobenzyl esterase